MITKKKKNNKNEISDQELCVNLLKYWMVKIERDGEKTENDQCEWWTRKQKKRIKKKFQSQKHTSESFWNYDGLCLLSSVVFHVHFSLSLTFYLSPLPLLFVVIIFFLLSNLCLLAFLTDPSHTPVHETLGNISFKFACLGVVRIAQSLLKDT